MADYQKDLKAKEAIKAAAGQFVARESNGQSLITVTDVDMQNEGKKAVILISVYPPHKGQAALDFLKRQRDELKDHIRRSVSLGRLPHFDVELDNGEKNRQRVDELLQQ